MTSPRRTRTSRGSADRLEGGNNSNINSNVPPAWHQARERLQQRMDRSTSAPRIRPRSWSSAPTTASSRESQHAVADQDQANQMII
eukprot:274861-Amphidinium_carterae.1